MLFRSNGLKKWPKNNQSSKRSKKKTPPKKAILSYEAGSFALIKLTNFYIILCSETPKTVFPRPANLWWSWLSYCSYLQGNLLLLRFYLFLFRERGRKREREGEKHWCVRNVSIGCLSHAPNQRPGLQPRLVPWLGIKLVTFCSSGQWSTHWAIQVRADVTPFKDKMHF